jgi:hypothetical protein
MLEGEIPKWEKVPIIKGLAETERFELSVPNSQHDGLAIHDPNAPNAAISGNIVCFYGVRACAERARRALKRNAFRHKSRHTSFGPLGHAENRCFDAKRARRAMTTASEPLEGLPPLPSAQRIAAKLRPLTILPWAQGQDWHRGEGRHEHHPCP